MLFRVKPSPLAGRMEYAVDVSDALQDDVLVGELAHTSDEKMKSVISTIQHEQNAIIRNESVQTLLIQGVAGSGKTSIALHRVAYLLYRFKDILKAQDVAIVSPNKVFSNYISNVIPELGEEPIVELGLDEIAAQALDGVVPSRRRAICSRLKIPLGKSGCLQFDVFAFVLLHDRSLV